MAELKYVDLWTGYTEMHKMLGGLGLGGFSHRRCWNNSGFWKAKKLLWIKPLLNLIVVCIYIFSLRVKWNLLTLHLSICVIKHRGGYKNCGFYHNDDPLLSTDHFLFLELKRLFIGRNDASTHSSSRDLLFWSMSFLAWILPKSTEFSSKMAGFV